MYRFLHTITDRKRKSSWLRNREPFMQGLHKKHSNLTAKLMKTSTAFREGSGKVMPRDRPRYRFTGIFPDIRAFYHNRISVL